MNHRIDSRSSFGPNLDFDDRPVLGSGSPRCSLELFAWRSLACAQAFVILGLIAVLVTR